MKKKKTDKLKKIFLSSIHQNAGKTTISIGLYKALKEKKLKVAFMKPVGQRFVSVGSRNIDKDSFLMGQVFGYRGDLKHMSPVTVGRGFTEQYILNPQKLNLQRKILSAFERLSNGKEAMIIEGTGHAGVGSVIDFSNADVASLLKAKVILILADP